MQIYLVGGAVRDELLGLAVGERDWVVVGATPEEMGARGFKPVGRSFPVFLHPETGEEYALARTERKTAPGYHGFEFFTGPGVTLEDDLRRRDLTINAIARGADGCLIDPHHGRRDIENRVLRHVSPAFTEDPVRVLRVARFAARFHPLGFRVADETIALMRGMVNNGEVKTLVAERVWKEFETTLSEPAPSRFFTVLNQVGALGMAASEAGPGLGRLPRSPDAMDAVGRAIDACASASRPAPVVFAALVLQATAVAADRGGDIDWTSACRRLRAPTAYLKIARSAAACRPFLEQDREPGARALLGLFETTDAFRDPARLATLLDAWRFCGAPLSGQDKERSSSRIRAALNAVSRLNLKRVAEAHGGNVGEAVRRARLDFLSQYQGEQ